jgi:hypothetical protein
MQRLQIVVHPTAGFHIGGLVLQILLRLICTFNHGPLVRDVLASLGCFQSLSLNLRVKGLDFVPSGDDLMYIVEG